MSLSLWPSFKLGSALFAKCYFNLRKTHEGILFDIKNILLQLIIYNLPQIFQVEKNIKINLIKIQTFPEGNVCSTFAYPLTSIAAGMLPRVNYSIKISS